MAGAALNQENREIGKVLDTFSKKDPNIPVVWCDTGYNNYQTYEHAKKLIEDLQLNIQIYTPNSTRGFIDVTMGLPAFNDPKHEAFTELVKLEPFRRSVVLLQVVAIHRSPTWLETKRSKTNGSLPRGVPHQDARGTTTTDVHNHSKYTNQTHQVTCRSTVSNSKSWIHFAFAASESTVST